MRKVLLVLEVYRITLLSNDSEFWQHFKYVLEVYRITLLSNRINRAKGV